MNRIGIDLGGTKIECISLEPNGSTVFAKRIVTPKAYPEIVQAIVNLAHEAGSGTVGIGAPGSVSKVNGLWRNANIVACNGRALPADITAGMNRPIRMENDANCFALSEALDGAGKGHAVVVFFTIGTALGGGLVIDGKMRAGPNAEAAEFGHTGLPWPNQADLPLTPCFCGKVGCAEQYVSGTGLERDYANETGVQLGGKEIVIRARGFEPAAQQALYRLQDRFARVAANILNVIDPDIFVIGGGLNGLPELVEEMPEIVMRYSFSGAAQVKFARAVHGENSGARGAAQLWPIEL